MNLLKKEIDSSENNISNFRNYQYKLLTYHIKNIFNYANSFGMGVPLNELKINQKESINYRRVNCTLLHNFQISHKDEKILSFLYPKLIDETFYILRGVKYVPIIYCVDEPMIIKTHSIFLSSLFSPISIEINKEKNRVNIQRKQFDISTFLRIFFSKNDVENICKQLNFTYTVEDEEKIIKKFSKLLDPGCDINIDIDYIKKILNKLFFDDHTFELYQKFYDIKEPDLKEILMKILLKLHNGEKKSFIDLSTKRLIMSEALLKPLFQSTTTIVNKLIKGENINKFILKNGTSCIYDHFINGLFKKDPYGSYNSFTGLLANKMTYNVKTKEQVSNTKNMETGLPNEVSGIHATYKEIICPTTTGNHAIGQTVHLVPSLILKDLKFGLFNL